MNGQLWRTTGLPAQWQFVNRLAQFVESCLVGNGVLVVFCGCAGTSAETWHVMMSTVTESGVIVFKGITAAIEAFSCGSTNRTFIGVMKIIIDGHDVVLVVNDAQFLQQTLNVLVFQVVIDAVRRAGRCTEFQFLLEHMSIV